MRTTIATMVGMPVLTIFTGHAQAAEPQRTGPYQVELQVGEVFLICKSGELICPAQATMCDNIKVVDVVDTQDGLAFVGMSPGETLCSAGSVNGLRRVFQVTVSESTSPGRR